MAVCIAIIGKDVRNFQFDYIVTAHKSIYNNPSIIAQDSPQYIATLDIDKEAELQYRVHAALDVIEEKCAGSQSQAQDSRDLYIGLLYSTEYHKMYGFLDEQAFSRTNDIFDLQIWLCDQQ